MADASNVEALWWTEDRSGIIQISPCSAGLCGRIVGQNNPHLANGGLPRDWRGDVECGLEILQVHQDDAPDVWDGSVLDPKTGQSWHCEISVGPDGNLRLRGYVLTPLLGETQTWTRFSGKVSPTCEIESGGRDSPAPHSR